LQRRGWFLRATAVALGFFIASANVAVAGKMGGFGGEQDPGGCRAKVRSEMGIAPYTASAYPSFWPKVRRCLESAGVTAPTATQPAAAQSIERSARKSAELRKKQEKPSAGTPRARKDDRDKTSDVKSATLAPPSIPSRLLDVAKPTTVGEFGRRVALVIGNGKYEHVPTLPNATNDAEALAPRAATTASLASSVIRLARS
jgi:hypothetical protein